MSPRFALLLGMIFTPNLLSQGQNSGKTTESAIQAPILGFVFDSQAHRIRPVLGVPGAAMLAQPVDVGMDIADAALSPGQDYALILTGDDRRVLVLRFRPDGVSTLPIDGAAAAPDRMRLSPSGSAAALYRQATGTVQVITGLPDAPTLARETGVTASGQNVTALAISDDGQVLIAGTGGSQAVLIVSADGNITSVPLNDGIRALAFRPNSQDAAVATAGNQIFLLPDIAHAPQPASIAGPKEGIAGPAAIEFSSDGQRLFAANPAAGTVTESDLAAGTTATLTCDCSPSGLYRLRGPAVFRLTEASTQLRLFDGSTTPSRILFVPADQTGGTPAANGNNAQRSGQ